jgi:2-succinyl-5-enolpyruvyl-6-hydroxy-3-cyclohexene-1-carboxylate synthase
VKPTDQAMKPFRYTDLDFRNTNSLWCSILVETLVRCGVRSAVISPGSRSAPLTFALARHPQLDCVPVLDERSAGFFALGLAKRDRRPVVLVCTSGTAAANFLPAVVEAYEGGAPLLVLTADRPPEMRDCQSGQTIDQQKLYGRYVQFAHEFAVPQATPALLRYLRQTTQHAVARSLDPMGPVHLNCPFRDPLPPIPEASPLALKPEALRRFFDEMEEVRSPRLAGESVRFPAAARGLILVGPDNDARGREYSAAAGRIARALGWPVLADALTPLRTHAGEVPQLVTVYDAVLRDPAVAEALRPERVLCLGGWPTSKALRGWLQQAEPEVTLVTARCTNPDALHLRTKVVRAGLGEWSGQFQGHRKLSAYGKDWLEASARVGRRLTAALKAEPELIEPKWPAILAAHLPPRTPCFIASSMPVRDAEYFWPANNRGHDVYFNRGANGIDGTLSTALGIAHGGDRPAVLVTGDLALLHDTNGFLSVSKFRGSLTILLINNQGGGIFEHLPVAKFDPPFEEFFATPQQVDFGRLAAAYGVKHVRVRDEAHLRRLVATLPARGVRVLEMRTDRKRDAAFRQQLFAGRK